MEPLYDIQLRHDTTTHQLTLKLADSPDKYGTSYFVVQYMSPGRILQEYQKAIATHLPELAAKETFLHMSVYLEWHNSSPSRKNYFEGAEIVFRLGPESNFFFRDYVGKVEVLFSERS